MHRYNIRSAIKLKTYSILKQSIVKYLIHVFFSSLNLLLSLSIQFDFNTMLYSFKRSKFNNLISDRD